MLSQDSLERATRRAGIEVPPRFLATTASTNADARVLAEDGAPEWTVVAAGHQTAGRGRRGRSWTSVPGRSLLCSVVLRPAMSPEDAPTLSLLAATEMSRAAAPAAVTAKWPNDLMAGERKVGGILPEARISRGHLEYLVLGIGVNVAMEREDFPPELRDLATSVAVEGGPPDPSELLERFLRGFRGAYRAGTPGFMARVVSEYAAVCSTIGRGVRATTAEGETVEGVAAGLDPRGGLVVSTDAGERRIAFGEVLHLR